MRTAVSPQHRHRAIPLYSFGYWDFAADRDHGKHAPAAGPVQPTFPSFPVGCARLEKQGGTERCYGAGGEEMAAAINPAARQFGRRCAVPRGNSKGAELVRAPD